MTSLSDLESFVASTFRSVWALELLLLLKREARDCSAQELIELMQASRSVIDKSLDTLIIAGLVSGGGGTACYRPANPTVDALVQETEQLYLTKPSHVRRLIITSAHKGLTAFADAFRLKD